MWLLSQNQLFLRDEGQGMEEVWGCTCDLKVHASCYKCLWELERGDNEGGREGEEDRITILKGDSPFSLPGSAVFLQ